MDSEGRKKVNKIEKSRDYKMEESKKNWLPVGKKSIAWKVVGDEC